MVGDRTERIEVGVDSVAAALYAAAVALVLFWLDASSAYVMGSTSVAFGWIFFGLRSVAREAAAFAVPAFHPIDFELVDIDELTLTDEDRLISNAGREDALILDDILAKIGADSRVVRLFDRAAMPIARQLEDGFNRHPGKADPGSAPPDASKALLDALAELRRALR